MNSINHNYSSCFTQSLLCKSLDLHINDIASVILNDPKFDVWSGSNYEYQHHYGKHGLAKHTKEVVDMCFSTKNTLNIDVDDIEVFLSALFHDTGKMYDYEPVDDTHTEWKATSHKRLIHHISRSAIIWNDAVNLFPSYNGIRDKVLHNILSHHGQREWGSPIMPKTRAAWLLHLCDGLSARMNDCDTLDLVSIKNNKIS